MFQIPEVKKEHWNRVSVDFLDEIKKEEIVCSEVSTTLDDDIVVLKPISIKPLYDYDVDCDENIVGVSYKRNDLIYRINGELWRKVKRCIDDFYKIKNIKNVVSKNSLQNIILSWLFETKIKEQITIEMTQNIEDELNKLTKEYIVYFPIPYLEANKTYQFSNEIFIGKLPNDNLRCLLTSLKETTHHPDVTFIYTKVIGERQFVIDNAYKYCSLAIDMIKICYLTFYADLFKICLDMANNINYLPINRCFIQEISSTDSLDVNEDINIHVSELDENFIKQLQAHCINEYAIFIDRIYKEENTELEKILNTAIRTYSRALSNSICYDKIVDLCSILDSLILSDNKETIKQALKKYVPLIITDDPVNRRSINESIETMYNIRSEYIHHRNTNKHITKSDMFEYNVLVFNLITQLVMVANSKRYKSMKEIIKVIDDKIKVTLENISFADDFL